MHLTPRTAQTLVTLLIALAVLTGPASAGPPYTWRSVRVGGGGFVPGIVFSRVQKGLAYLRSDMGGAYRWEASAGAWVPLQDAQCESAYQGTESVAPDPIDPDVVYLAAGMYRSERAAMLRSADRGNTWEVFPVPFRMGGNEDGRGLGERLAIDPNNTSILYFGSRNDGLQRSEDKARTWQQVAGFPSHGLGIPPQRMAPHGGISFVVFDPASGMPGTGSKTLFVGLADPGDRHLFRSDDAGATWAAVPGGPNPNLFPAKAEIDGRGMLYLTYANGIGPNGVTEGAVFRLDTHSVSWTDITPEKGPGRYSGGYMGLSLDRQHTGTLAVATMNRWSPGDTVWRTADNGANWKDIAANARRDVAETPFLLWGQRDARLGWWMAALAIDPFDSNFAAYGTGATIYATREFSNVSDGAPSTWAPWTRGIEQTAIITLASPPVGPHLLSGFGDISGFAHEDLETSPAANYANPAFGNTDHIAYAGAKPEVVVRSGTPSSNGGRGGGETLAISEDAGRTWVPLHFDIPSTGGRGQRGGEDIEVSADGATLMVMTSPPRLSRDRGATWSPARGLPPHCRPVADRVDLKRFYAVDFATAKVFASVNGGASFAELAGDCGLTNLAGAEPSSREAPWPLHAAPGRAGELWLVAHGALHRSTDGGQTFAPISSGLTFSAIAFGMAAPGADHPALFAIAAERESKAIWRSNDSGVTWLRINDDQHQYGTRFRCIEGDPRVFGRVYVGTDGRGVLYGEPASPN